MTPTTSDLETLDRQGYLVLEDFMPPALLTALRERVAELHRSEGEEAGSEFKQEPGCVRLANLVDKGEVFQQVIANDEVLARVERVLGPRFKLSSLNARTALPKSNTHQPLHADMGAVADEQGYWVCNTVWMLDDYTADNGALRCVPGSHLVGQTPQTAMPDPRDKHPDEVLVTGRAGTVVVMNAHLWHGGLANLTERPRTSLHAFYARRDKPQQQYQKKLLRRDVQDGLSPKLRELLALDDPLNDEVSAEVAVRSGFLK